MTDDGDRLKQRLQHAHDGRRTPRRQRRSLLASGQAQTRQAVAPRLGVHRDPIGHWRAIDETGGLEAWRAVDVPAGKPIARAPAVLASVAPALRAPVGVASSAARRQGVKQTHPVEVHEHTRYTRVRTRFRAQLKGPRPSPTNKP